MVALRAQPFQEVGNDNLVLTVSGTKEPGELALHKTPNKILELSP